jgi:hypothetical protein
MKRILAIMLLVTAALVVNAQKTPVNVADLKKPIVDNVAKDFAGFTIKDANKVVTNNVTTYEVNIVKGTTHETLCYDKDGKFMKKMTAPQSATAKPASTTVAKTNPPATKTPVKK